MSDLQTDVPQVGRTGIPKYHSHFSVCLKDSGGGTGLIKIQPLLERSAHITFNRWSKMKKSTNSETSPSREMLCYKEEKEQRTHRRVGLSSKAA